MVVGQRDETLQEKNFRHIKEMEADIEGWKRELDLAMEISDKVYEDYCTIMIQICENTIFRLKEFATKNFIWHCTVNVKL